MPVKTAPCKICAAESRHVCTTRHSIDATRTLDHYRCTDCGLVFVGTEVSLEELTSAYAALNGSSYYDEIEVELHRKMESSIRDLRRRIGTDASVLDIGTGSGKFLRCLLEHGFRDVAGHDLPGDTLAPDLVGRCELYLDTDWSTVPSSRFDVVTLLDVAEHVIDPLALFRACRRILKPGGILYFHTPVVTPIDRVMHALHKLPLTGRMARAWQNGRTTIFHLQNFTRASLSRAMDDCGFEQTEIHVENELSWPVRKYVADYLVKPAKLPTWTTGPLTLAFRPILATNLLNPNKGVVTARTPAAVPRELARAA